MIIIICEKMHKFLDTKQVYSLTKVFVKYIILNNQPI